MLRLFMREKLEEIDTETSRLIAALQKKAARAKASMPGYTHQQKAMPTSVKRWLGSFIDALKDARIILRKCVVGARRVQIEGESCRTG